MTRSCRWTSMRRKNWKEGKIIKTRTKQSSSQRISS